MRGVPARLAGRWLWMLASVELVGPFIITGRYRYVLTQFRRHGTSAAANTCCVVRRGQLFSHRIVSQARVLSKKGRTRGGRR